MYTSNEPTFYHQGQYINGHLEKCKVGTFFEAAAIINDMEGVTVSSTNSNGEIQRFNSKLLQKTTTKRILPSIQVSHKVSIVHDCFDGHCKFEEAKHTFMEEREGVERSTLVF